MDDWDNGRYFSGGIGICDLCGFSAGGATLTRPTKRDAFRKPVLSAPDTRSASTPLSG